MSYGPSARLGSHGRSSSLPPPAPVTPLEGPVPVGALADVAAVAVPVDVPPMTEIVAHTANYTHEQLRNSLVLSEQRLYQQEHEFHYDDCEGLDETSPLRFHTGTDMVAG